MVLVLQVLQNGGPREKRPPEAHLLLHHIRQLHLGFLGVLDVHLVCTLPPPPKARQICQWKGCLLICLLLALGPLVAVCGQASLLTTQCATSSSHCSPSSWDEAPPASLPPCQPHVGGKEDRLYPKPALEGEA